MAMLKGDICHKEFCFSLCIKLIGFNMFVGKIFFIHTRNINHGELIRRRYLKKCHHQNFQMNHLLQVPNLILQILSPHRRFNLQSNPQNKVHHHKIKRLPTHFLIQIDHSEPQRHNLHRCSLCHFSSNKKPC